MKKLLFIFLLPLALYAQSFLISNIPIPKSYIQNLDPYPCDESCLKAYVSRGMIFSFLAHADSKLNDRELDDIRMMSISILNLGSFVQSSQLKIALLLPYKRIGHYASSTTNASFAYLLSMGNPFELKSYKVDSEERADIERALKEIQNDGFFYVIAPLTREGALVMTQINPRLNVYIPTVNKSDINTTSTSLYFGGIDYKAQSDILLKEATTPLVVFDDKSTIGESLTYYQKERFSTLPPFLDALGSPIKKSFISISIPKRTTNLEAWLKDNQKINNASFMVNTPIVKTGMVLSQLTLYDANVTNILSTQINYDPLLLSMTQYQDRKKMVIANSITQENNIISESNALLSTDIVYDWINYSTTIGIDLFYSHITGENRQYSIELLNNQIVYPIELIRPSINRFIKYYSPSEE